MPAGFRPLRKFTYFGDNFGEITETLCDPFKILLKKENVMYQLMAILACLFTTILSSCASPYIGRSINYNSDRVCRAYLYPSECSITGKNMLLSFSVDQSDKDNEFIIKGNAILLGSLGNWDRVNQMRITFLLANNGVITESITSLLGTNEGGEPIPFKRKFKTDNMFDAITFSYSVSVSQ